MTKRALILTIVAALWLSPTSLWAGPPFSADSLAKVLNSRLDWVASEVQLGDHTAPGFSGESPVMINAFLQHGLVTRTPNGFNQIITPTQKGLAMAQESGLPQRPGYFQVRVASYQVTKLVKSESLRSATASWQYALFTYVRDPGPVGAAIDAQRARAYTKDRKAKALLQYDEISSQWALKVFDAANLNEELATNNVDQAITNLGLRRE